MTAEHTARATSRTAKTTDSKARTARTAKAQASKPSSTVESAEPSESPQNPSPTDSGDAMNDTTGTDNVVQITPRSGQDEAKKKPSAIQLQKTSLTIWDLPAMPSEFEFSETMSVAGVRPIETSHLALVGSFLNGRPISASTLTVHEMLPGDRPVFDSDFKTVDSLMLAGNRPVMMSDPHLMEASVLPGNRPIASNEIDPDPSSLMGYLD
jgi:hypothetical protein